MMDDGESKSKLEKEFKLELKHGDKSIKMEIPLKIPFEETRVQEFSHLILTSFDLPIIFENGACLSYVFYHHASCMDFSA